MNGNGYENDRFDDDLRSVLREETPPDAPTALRQRVAAIPAAMPVPVKPRRTWSLAWPLLATAAGAFVLVVAIATLRAGQEPPSGVGGQASPSLAAVASGAAASATPSVAPSPSAKPSPSSHPASSAVSAVPPPCAAADLTAAIMSWQGAAGSRIATIEVENHSPGGVCMLQGDPGLRLIDATGRVLIESSHFPAVIPKSSWVKLGASTQIMVRVANYCGPTPASPIDIGLVLAGGGGTVIAKPHAGVSSADAIPPCNGPAGPEIDTTGWGH
jgi:hypothetical protein